MNSRVSVRFETGIETLVVGSSGAAGPPPAAAELDPETVELRRCQAISAEKID